LLTVTNQTLGTAITTSTAADKFGTLHTLRRNATYSPDVSAKISGVTTLPGRYIDTKGWLSWNNRLQDGDFYQEYSYVIRVSELVDRYVDVLKRVLHPAGTKFFGFYEIPSTFDLSNTSVSLVSDIEDAFVLWGANTGLFGNVFISAEFANSTITPYSSVFVRLYANVTAGVFDGSARLVRAIKGTSQFANGLLKATTGSISATGSGSLIRITKVSSATSNTTNFQVNTIFSNTIFTLRTPYVPVASNATFKYLP